MRTLRRGLVKMGLVAKRAENVNEDYVSYDDFAMEILYQALELTVELSSPSRSRSPLVLPARALSTASATFAW